MYEQKVSCSNVYFLGFATKWREFLGSFLVGLNVVLGQVFYFYFCFLNFIFLFSMQIKTVILSRFCNFGVTVTLSCSNVYFLGFATKWREFLGSFLVGLNFVLGFATLVLLSHFLGSYGGRFLGLFLVALNVVLGDFDIGRKGLESDWKLYMVEYCATTPLPDKKLLVFVLDGRLQKPTKTTRACVADFGVNSSMLKPEVSSRHQCVCRFGFDFTLISVFEFNFEHIVVGDVGFEAWGFSRAGGGLAEGQLNQLTDGTREAVMKVILRTLKLLFWGILLQGIWPEKFLKSMQSDRSEDLNLLVQHVHSTNFKRTCLYLTSAARVLNLSLMMKTDPLQSLAHDIEVARDEDLMEQILKAIYFDLVDHDSESIPFNLFKCKVVILTGIVVWILFTVVLIEKCSAQDFSQQKQVLKRIKMLIKMMGSHLSTYAPKVMVLLMHAIEKSRTSVGQRLKLVFADCLGALGAVDPAKVKVFRSAPDTVIQDSTALAIHELLKIAGCEASLDENVVVSLSKTQVLKDKEPLKVAT
ncbi:hypothetical protein Ddye_003520 [Dipteronia dyeriana]|uniref:UME domain-containing protein n=1 Tax=Dipteronia dyeriana TaxID=168575 RepID=A0AAE0CVF7_9ROSI|nr:hypothetical protein Ddye_003520 [Dipteronia dyeriana]